VHICKDIFHRPQHPQSQNVVQKRTPEFVSLENYRKQRSSVSSWSVFNTLQQYHAGGRGSCFYHWKEEKSDKEFLHSSSVTVLRPKGNTDFGFVLSAV